MTSAATSATNQQINAIVSKHPLSADYLYYALVHRSPSLPSLAGRAAVPIVNKSNFARFLVPLPPPNEQQSIAHILRTVQKAIESTEKVIEASRELKRSLMNHHLFTYGPVPVDEAEQVPLKETEIGSVPENWTMVNLGNVCDVKGGKRLPKGRKFSDQSTRHPYIRVVDFKNNSVNMTELKYLAEEDYEVIKRYAINSEDVYISIAGTIGLVGTVPLDLHGANLTENAAKLVLKEGFGLARDFLMYFLASQQGQHQIATHTTKTSQPKLALTRIKQILLPIPDHSEQVQIVNALRAVDIKIAVEENRQRSLKVLFKTLLHNLMTGKVRVNDLDLSTVEEMV